MRGYAMRKGMTSEQRRVRVQALWDAGERHMDGQDLLDFDGGNRDERDMALYLQAKKYGIKSLMLDEVPGWLYRSLRADWMDGQFVATPRPMKLSERQSEAIGLVNFMGMTLSEAGEKMGLDRRVCQKHLSRAHKKIRLHMLERNIRAENWGLEPLDAPQP